MIKKRKSGAFKLSAACLLAGLMFLQDDVMANPAENWAWQYRPLIVVAPDRSDQKLADQRRQLASLEGELRDRDMAVVEIVDKQVTVAMGPDREISGEALMAELGISGDRFEVMLLGKDTGVKLHSELPVAAADLFALIDSMPMRQREMAR